jgi:hypothetical protein
MKDQLREWCDEAWAAVQEIPGGVGAELRARWEAHALRDHVVVTFFGPYDSGKSSLLKRLLVDDGEPVPDWLTVSGRRETFEPKEVSVAGLVVRDTPGIAGGNELHEAIAKDALLLTDAIVLVLPPQLVTSDRESLVAVFNGRRFACAARFAFAERSLPIVLSRMDEAGAMPRDDSQGYRELVERKRKELLDLLQTEGGTGEVVVVHAVAADPFGLVGNALPSGREEYDADRSWDGIAGFTDFLQSLTRRKDELRQHAEVRFLGAEISSIRAAVEAMGFENHTATEVASNEATAHQLVQERLRALLGAARADLDRQIEEQVSAASRRGAAGVKELREAVLGRLQEGLDRWSKQHDAALEALMREADLELQVRRTRPAWKKLAEVLGDAGPAAAAPNGKEARQTVDKVQKVTKTLHKGFREAQPAVIGMPLEKARQELQKLRQAASFEEYAKQARKGTTPFKDTAHATQARRAVLVDDVFDVALPAILELGGLLAEAWSESKAVEHRAKRREEVRKVIEESTKKLADRAWSLWRDEGMPSALEAALNVARGSAAAAAASLRSEGQAITTTRDRLSGLLVKLEGAA